MGLPGAVFWYDAVRAKRTIVWVAVVLAAVGGGAMARLAMSAIGLGQEVPPGLLIASTGFWTALVVYYAVDRRFGVVRLAVLAPVAGCLNGGTVLASSAPNLPEAVMGFFAGTLLSAVVAVPLGLAYAAVLAPYVWLARGAIGDRSLDGPEHMGFMAASWLTLIGVVLTLQPGGHDGGAAASSFGLALFVAALVARRDVRRALFLRAVRRGREPDYRIDAEGAHDRALPTLTGRASRGEVLRATALGGGDPYRGRDVSQGLARVGAGGLREFHRMRLLALPLLVALQLGGLVAVHRAPPPEPVYPGQLLGLREYR